MEQWDILDENRNKTGRIHNRGETLNKGDYHLVVFVWIKNSKNEYLITKRAPIKNPFPNIWTCTGGAALKGETSLDAVLRETEEEIGIKLDTSSGNLINSTISRTFFADIWLFKQDIDINELVLQPEEVGDAMWASVDKIDEMIEQGLLMSRASCFQQVKNY